MTATVPIVERDAVEPLSRPGSLTLVNVADASAAGRKERYVRRSPLSSAAAGRPSLWLARDGRLGCDVVYREFAAGETLQMERETAALRAQLAHVPHLIDCSERGDDPAWLVRSFVPGKPLCALAPMKAARALEIAARIAWLAHSLHAARPKGWAMGAARPGSFVAEPEGSVWLVDTATLAPLEPGEDRIAQDIVHVGRIAAALLVGASDCPPDVDALLADLPVDVSLVLGRMLLSQCDGHYASMKWAAAALDALVESLKRAPTESVSARAYLPPPRAVFRPVKIASSPVAHSLAGSGALPSLDWARLAASAPGAEYALDPRRLICLDTLDIDRYAHQIDSAARIVADPEMAAGAILADEVGLGKTVEALIAAQELRARRLVESILIVAQPSGALQWLTEARMRVRRNAYDHGFRLYQSARDAGYPLLIVSAATLRQDRHIERLRERTFDLVIVDEAHQCCAAGAQLSTLGRAVDSLGRRRTLLLSATPLGNRLGDLYTLANLVRPGMLGSVKEFQTQIAQASAAVSARSLRTRVASIMVRHRRADLREVVSPRLAYRIERPSGSGTAARVERAAGIICGEWAGERVVVFARSSTMRAALASQIARLCPERVVVSFQGNRRASRGFERQFNDFPGAVILSGDTVAEGMNWQRARCLMHLDAPLTPLVWEQRTGRIFRLGQSSPDLEIVAVAADGSPDDQLLQLYGGDLGMFDLPVGEAASALDELADAKLRNLELPARSCLRGDLTDDQRIALAVALRDARARYDRRVAEESGLDALVFGDDFTEGTL